MTKEELIKNQFPNDEFLQSAVLQIVDKCVAELEKENARLKAQIEKMKCCSMCKYYSMRFLPYFCTKNGTSQHCTSNCDKWEIKEK